MAALLTLALLLAGIVGVDAPASATTVDDSVARADELRRNGELGEVVAILEKARSAEPANGAVLWRLARAYVDRGDRASGDERMEHYETARSHAEEAASAAPDDPDAHVWLAISLGKLADVTTSGRDRLAFATRIEQQAVRILELDPGRDEALYMLASIRYEMAMLPWYQRTLASLLPGELPAGSLREAQQFARMAVDVSPKTIRYRLLLAKVLIARGEEDRARQVIEALLELPVRTADERRQRERAAELMAKL